MIGSETKVVSASTAIDSTVPAGTRSFDVGHPSETATVLPDTSTRSALALLLTNHIIRDGEIVILALKPSLYFILFQSLPVAAVSVLMALIANLLSNRLPGWQLGLIYDAAVFVLALRLIMAMLQWLGRLYVLTDRRILRISGVFAMEVFDCPLRKIEHCELATPPLERACHVGSIEVLPSDQLAEKPTSPGGWQTISHPHEVHEKIRSAIQRAGPFA